MYLSKTEATESSQHDLLVEKNSCTCFLTVDTYNSCYGRTMFLEYFRNICCFASITIAVYVRNKWKQFVKQKNSFAPNSFFNNYCCLFAQALSTSGPRFVQSGLESRSFRTMEFGMSAGQIFVLKQFVFPHHFSW